MSALFEAPSLRTRQRQGSIVFGPSGRVRLWQDHDERCNAITVHAAMLAPGTTRIALKPGSIVTFDIGDDDRSRNLKLLGR